MTEASAHERGSLDTLRAMICERQLICAFTRSVLWDAWAASLRS